MKVSICVPIFERLGITRLLIESFLGLFCCSPG